MFCFIVFWALKEHLKPVGNHFLFVSHAIDMLCEAPCVLVYPLFKSARTFHNMTYYRSLTKLILKVRKLGLIRHTIYVFRYRPSATRYNTVFHSSLYVGYSTVKLKYVFIYKWHCLLVTIRCCNGNYHVFFERKILRFTNCS